MHGTSTGKQGHYRTLEGLYMESFKFQICVTLTPVKYSSCLTHFHDLFN